MVSNCIAALPSNLNSPSFGAALFGDALGLRQPPCLWVPIPSLPVLVKPRTSKGTMLERFWRRYRPTPTLGLTVTPKVASIPFRTSLKSKVPHLKCLGRLKTMLSISDLQCSQCRTFMFIPSLDDNVANLSVLTGLCAPGTLCVSLSRRSRAF